MDYSKYLTAWTKKSFRDGVNPPTVSSSDAEALAYVSERRVAAAMSRARPAPGVLVVATF